MHYQFPVIRNISDVLPHIDEDHFRVVDKEGITFINYNSLMPSTFPEITEGNYLTAVIRRECRGIAFDTETGGIVSRPFHKFFNMGERPDAQFVDDNHELLEKLDGSMIRPLPYKGGIRLGTKMGVTDIAMKAEEFIADKKNYWEFLEMCTQFDLTPIFEYLGPYNRVVMEYPESMVLLAIRHNEYGDYYDTKYYSEDSDIPIVQPSKHPLESIKERDDQEGVVIRYSNGHMLKVKTDWYVKAHRAKELLTSDRRFLEAILNESIDDVLPTFLPEDQERVKRKLEQFEIRLDKLSEVFTLDYEWDRKVHPTKKDFAIATKDEGNVYRQLTFKLWDGKIESMREGIMNMLERATLSQKNYDETMDKLKLFESPYQDGTGGEF